MAQNADVKAPPNYPQQGGYPSNQPTYNGAAAPQSMSYANPQGQAQYAQSPQGSPYTHPAGPGAQYQQGYQQQPQQQWAAAPQPVIVTQPQVLVTQPQVVMGGCPPGQHFFTTHFGACGIIAAILLFPIGLIFLFTDQERRCSRCGMRG